MLTRQHAKEKSAETRRISNALANVKMADMKGGEKKPVNKKLNELNTIDKQLRTVDSASALARHSAKRTSVVGTFGYKAVSARIRASHVYKTLSTHSLILRLRVAGNVR